MPDPEPTPQPTPLDPIINANIQGIQLALVQQANATLVMSLAQAQATIATLSAQETFADLRDKIGVAEQNTRDALANLATEQSRSADLQKQLDDLKAAPLPEPVPEGIKS